MAAAAVACSGSRSQLAPTSSHWSQFAFEVAAVVGMVAAVVGMVAAVVGVVAALGEQLPHTLRCPPRRTQRDCMGRIQIHTEVGLRWSE